MSIRWPDDSQQIRQPDLLQDLRLRCQQITCITFGSGNSGIELKSNTLARYEDNDIKVIVYLFTHVVGIPVQSQIDSIATSAGTIVWVSFDFLTQAM